YNSNVMRARFRKRDLQRVREAVRKAESATSGEIVPVILPRSQNYFWLPSVMGLRIGALAFALVEAWSYFGWPIPWADTVAIVATATVLAMVLSNIPILARFLIGRKRLHAGVLDRTRSLFITQGITETQDRTGVLVFVSKFEREISILAD